jgi:hypothetical protein
MAEQRIINAPTAEDYTNDSYVLIDGQTNGTRKILISNILNPPEPDYLYKWDFTKSLIDEIEGSEVTLGANAVRTSSGVFFTGKGDRIIFDNTIDIFFKTIEIDVASCDFQGNSNYDMNFLITPTPRTYYASPLSFIKNKGWGAYTYNMGATSQIYPNTNNRNYINNGTVKIVTKHHSGSTSEVKDIYFYFNGDLVGTINNFWLGDKYQDKSITIGGGNESVANGDQCYNMTITGVRIYENEEM